MKKITCIQNYVIDKLIEDEKLSTNSLLDAVSKVCSKEQFNFSLNQTKEYVDSCIGKFNILPKTIMQTEIDEITKKLEPYNVTISILGFFIKKVNAVNITASTL